MTIRQRHARRDCNPPQHLDQAQVASAANHSRQAAEAAEERRVASRQAAHDRLTARTGPRRTSDRAAAARATTKLRQQARSGRSGSDTASSGDEFSSDGQLHRLQGGGSAAGEYDPLGPLHADLVRPVAAPRCMPTNVGPPYIMRCCCADDPAGNGSSSNDSVSLADSSASDSDGTVLARQPRPAASAQLCVLSLTQSGAGLLQACTAPSMHFAFEKECSQAAAVSCACAAGARGDGPGDGTLDAAGTGQEDEQLQQALALSLADVSTAARPPDTGQWLGMALVGMC